MVEIELEGVRWLRLCASSYERERELRLWLGRSPGRLARELCDALAGFHEAA